MIEIPSKARRRLLSFSLRGLMLSILVIAVALVWTIHDARKQAATVAALRKMGCRVWGKYTDNSTTPLEEARKLFGEEISRNVVGVDAESAPLTDDDLIRLPELPELQELFLRETQVTDVGLSHVKELIHLQSLDLGETQVTDAGLIHLQGLTQLIRLNLDGLQVSDAGMVHLQRLTQIRMLHLDGTQVTDAGLVHLQGLDNLLLLSVSETGVTDAGVQELKKAQPECHVNR